MKPYAIISDLHFHSWSAFSTVLETGVNSRLQGLLDEVYRCAKELKAVGGEVIYVAGDVFHVRGSVAPSVFNPVIQMVKELTEDGFEFRIIPGNHDLEGKSSTRIGSAVTMLESAGADICHKARRFNHDERSVLMLPWYENLDELREVLADSSEVDPQNTSVIIHAPLNGVITSLPNHGLSHEELAAYGFKHVFAGHHHNHKDFGDGVFSIGALAHHTWSDVDTKAGFIIVGDKVKWFKSHLPAFVDITAEMDIVDAELIAEGNFVRAKITTSKTIEVEEMRSWLMGAGAKGVVVHSVKESVERTSEESSGVIKSGASLETSVSEYVKVKFPTLAEQINIECQKVLAETGI